jgi:predicted dehydrogenase
MIERDRSARRATLVGFNFIIERFRRELKARLLQGDFGRLREIRLLGRWPRPTAYFERNSWAGRLLAADGRIILDSCLGNAMAHFVHNLLFWAGLSGVSAWANLRRVGAELDRVHRIEGSDTFFVLAETEDDVVLRIALSHACSDSLAPVESLHCERATLHYSVGQGVEIAWRDGRTERHALGPFDALRENHLEYYRYLRGESPRPATTLADCRAIVALNDLAHVSSNRIHTLAPDRYARTRNEQEQREYLSIHDLASAQTVFINEGLWPGARGWGHPAGPSFAGPADLGRFDAVVRRMATEAPTG